MPYKLHIFRVNEICFIVPFFPCAQGIEMVSVFTSPDGIYIWLALFYLGAVPGGDSLCIGWTNITVHGFVVSFQFRRLLTRRILSAKATMCTLQPVCFYCWEFSRPSRLQYSFNSSVSYVLPSFAVMLETGIMTKGDYQWKNAHIVRRKSKTWRLSDVIAGVN